MAPAPGFYPDPDPSAAAGSLRWWDGSQWTTHVRAESQPAQPPQPLFAAPAVAQSQSAAFPPAPASAPSPPWGMAPPAFDPRADLAAERAAAPIARIAAVVAFAAVAIDQILYAHQYATHPFHWVTDASGVTVLRQSGGPISAGYTLVELLLSLLYLGSLGLFLRWIHRAATLANRAGLPARRSPGMAVGSWFIPIVNLWFPYQGMRDLTPAGDPARRIAQLVWTGFIGGTVVGTAAIFSGLLGASGLAVGCAVVAALAQLFTIMQCLRLISTVDAAHDRLVGRFS